MVYLFNKYLASKYGFDFFDNKKHDDILQFVTEMNSFYINSILEKTIPFLKKKKKNNSGGTKLYIYFFL